MQKTFVNQNDEAVLLRVRTLPYPHAWHQGHAQQRGLRARKRGRTPPPVLKGAQRPAPAQPRLCAQPRPLPSNVTGRLQQGDDRAARPN
eukprot:6985076-Prymnesium_polylepis.1